MLELLAVLMNCCESLSSSAEALTTSNNPEIHLQTAFEAPFWKQLYL